MSAPLHNNPYHFCTGNRSGIFDEKVRDLPDSFGSFEILLDPEQELLLAYQSKLNFL